MKEQASVSDSQTITLPNEYSSAPVEIFRNCSHN